MAPNDLIILGLMLQFAGVFFGALTIRQVWLARRRSTPIGFTTPDPGLSVDPVSGRSIPLLVVNPYLSGASVSLLLIGIAFQIIGTSLLPP